MSAVEGVVDLDATEALTASGGLEIVQDDELEDATHPTALPSVDAAFAALAAYRTTAATT